MINYNMNYDNKHRYCHVLGENAWPCRIKNILMPQCAV